MFFWSFSLLIHEHNLGLKYHRDNCFLLNVSFLHFAKSIEPWKPKRIWMILCQTFAGNEISFQTFNIDRVKIHFVAQCCLVPITFAQGIDGLRFAEKTALFMGLRSARRRHLKGNSYHDDISRLNCVHVLRETSENQKGCETKTTRVLRRQLVPFFTVWNLEHWRQI